MRSTSVPVAAVQFTSSQGNPIANLDRISQLAAEAHAKGARLIVFPELANTGYFEDVELHSLAEDTLGQTVQGLVKIASRLGVYLAAGFVERFQGDVYNSLAFCTPRGQISIYRKRHLIFWEHSYFRAGRDPLIVQTDLGRIGFAICADMMYSSVWSHYRGLIDLAVIAAAWPRRTRETGFRVGWMLEPSWSLAGELPTRIASELKIPVVFANHCGACHVRIPQLGPATPAAFAGRTGVFDEHGHRLTKEHDSEEVVIGTVSVPEENMSCVTLSA